MAQFIHLLIYIILAQFIHPNSVIQTEKDTPTSEEFRKRHTKKNLVKTLILQTDSADKYGSKTSIVGIKNFTEGDKYL